MHLGTMTWPERPTRPAAAGAIGARTLLASELLCESVDLRAGERVLAAACGSGNAALAAARRFCQVVGLDAPEPLAPARRRAEAEGLEVTFLEGDADELPFPDGCFDVALSAAEAMAPTDQGRAVGELLRVCRPGGRVGLVCWEPRGYVGELLAAVSGARPPAGGERRLCGLLGPGAAVAAPRRSLLWRFPSAEHQVELLASCHRPTAAALQAPSPGRAAALRRELLALARRFDVSDDDTLVLQLDYLEVVARKPAWR